MKRIYVVTHKQMLTQRLVKAHTQAEAIRHVARKTFDCDVASAMLVAELMAKGVQVEVAGATDPIID